MNQKKGYLVSVVAIIAMLAIAGCVAPPKESPASVTYTYNPDATTSTTTSASAYVTEVTPYVNTQGIGIEQTETSGYHTFATPTPIPADKSCRIYTSTQPYLYNGTAFTFNLKNPPMYINYTVKPVNVTVKRAATETYLNKKDVIYEYSTYDPQSYFIITVRNKTSGEIYLQDGFGNDYAIYLTRTLKVLNTDDMLIEMKGNKITATVNFWVKPSGNFDDADNMTFDTCTYWDGVPRENTVIPATTATKATPNLGTIIKK